MLGEAFLLLIKFDIINFVSRRLMKNVILITKRNTIFYDLF